MNDHTNRVPVQASPAPDSRKPPPLLWATLGFLGGLLPLIVFIVSVSVARYSHAPAPIASADSIATAPDRAAPAPAATSPAPVAAPVVPAAVVPAAVVPAGGRMAAVPAVGADATTRERPAALTPVTPTATAAAPASAAMLARVTPRDVAQRAVAEDAGHSVAFPDEPETPVEAEAEPAPAAPLRSAQPAPPPRPHARPEPPANSVDNVIRGIISQRWTQNGSAASFPKSGNIRCSIGKKDVSCWTNALTGDHYTGPYRYKIKMILDKFSADGGFIMTYRELILRTSASPAAAETEDINNLSTAIKPGWAPMIHRLPCQLRGADRIVCSPVGENLFVLNGVRLQASADR